CNFMVREGIVLGHQVSCNGIEVDHAKIDTIKKLSTTFFASFLIPNHQVKHLKQENPLNQLRLGILYHK
ncbi:hypothetical protein, partial [Campylobacter jejuni]|uniref:hypothetical protein n=1 Tax=Campylobacter jejuni TaxID=197 RepID=UPI002F96B98E